METYQITTQQAIWIAVLVAWDIVWKSIGLWRSAKNNDKAWFVAILIVNSVGILPIIYLLSHKQTKGAKND